MVDFSPICTHKHAIITCQSKTTLKYIPILSQHLSNTSLIKGECKLKQSLSHLNMFTCPLAEGKIPAIPGSTAHQAVPASALLPGQSAEQHTSAEHILLCQSQTLRGVELQKCRGRGSELHPRGTVAVLFFSRWLATPPQAVQMTWHTADGSAGTEAAGVLLAARAGSSSTGVGFCTCQIAGCSQYLCVFVIFFLFVCCFFFKESSKIPIPDPLRKC